MHTCSFCSLCTFLHRGCSLHLFLCSFCSLFAWHRIKAWKKNLNYVKLELRKFELWILFSYLQHGSPNLFEKKLELCETRITSTRIIWNRPVAQTIFQREICVLVLISAVHKSCALVRHLHLHSGSCHRMFIPWVALSDVLLLCINPKLPLILSEHKRTRKTEHAIVCCRRKLRQKLWHLFIKFRSLCISSWNKPQNARASEWSTIARRTLHSKLNVRPIQGYPSFWDIQNDH